MINIVSHSVFRCGRALQRFDHVVLLGALCVLCGEKSALAAEAPAKVTYAEHVRPIFQQSCFACHSQDDMNSDLALDSYGAVMSGGAGGEIVAAGDPDGSRLWALVTHADSPEMPPGGDKLPDDQLALIRAWIDGGLLENAGSKPRKGPAVAVAAAPTTDNRPEGEPAMPAGVVCEPVVAPDRAAAVGAIAVSPWAPLVAIGGPQQVSLYHLHSGQLLGVLPYLEGEPLVLRFSRDGSLLLIAGGRHGAFGNAALYDVATGVRVATVGEEVDAVLAADVSPDQSLVAVGGPKKVARVYRVADGSVAYEIRKHTDWVTALEFSPDGKLLATADRAGAAYLWDARGGHEAASLSGHQEHIAAMSWRADSQMLATASEDDTVRLWTTTGTQAKSFNAHGGGVLSVDWHRDGQIVTAGRDRKLKLWDGNGKHLGDLADTPDVALVARLGFEAKLAAVGDWQGGVRIVDAAQKQVLRELTPNPPRLAVRLELAQQAAEQQRSAHEAAAAALAAAQAELAAADTALAQQREQLQKADDTAAATNRQRVAAAKQVAERVAAWRAATEAAASTADKLVAAEQQHAAAQRALAEWQVTGQPGGDAKRDELQAAVKQTGGALEQARAAAAAADRALAEAAAAKQQADNQAVAAADAHRAAAAEASARRQAEPAADRAAAQAKASASQATAADTAAALAAAEAELARATELFQAYSTARERYAQAIAAAEATAGASAEALAQREAAQAVAQQQLSEKEQQAAALAEKLAELQRQHDEAVSQSESARQAAEAAAGEVTAASAAQAAAARTAALAAARAEQFEQTEVARGNTE